jgi:putative acetyltransferase
MIVKGYPIDYDTVTDIWERSVRASHHFLPEDYLLEIRRLLPKILPLVDIYLYREQSQTLGFAGVAGKKLEMLFVDPLHFGRGVGRSLVQYCLHHLGTNKVDVNEQNQTALEFYIKMGYRQFDRKELDSMGRPYPILELQYFAKDSSQ